MTCIVNGVNYSAVAQNVIIHELANDLPFRCFPDCLILQAFNQSVNAVEEHGFQILIIHPVFVQFLQDALRR